MSRYETKAGSQSHYPGWFTSVCVLGSNTSYIIIYNHYTLLLLSLLLLISDYPWRFPGPKRGGPPVIIHFKRMFDVFSIVHPTIGVPHDYGNPLGS